MRFFIVALFALTTGCATQGAFDRLSNDVAKGFETLKADQQESRAAQSAIEAELAVQVSEIVDSKTVGLVSQEQAEAQTIAAITAARAEVERIESERLAKAEQESRVMEAQAEVRKLESAEEQKALVQGLVTSGIGIALGSPAAASAINAAVSAAVGGDPASKEDVEELRDKTIAALKEGGLTHEEAAGYGGAGLAAALWAMNAWRNRSRRRDLDGVRGQPPATV